MNTNPLILAALANIGIPTKPINYTGDEKEYITFNDSDNRAIDYADNIDITESAIIQVHYWTQGNPKERAKEIRKALRQAGFVYLNTVEFFESAGQYYHCVIEVRWDSWSETQ